LWPYQIFWIPTDCSERANAAKGFMRLTNDRAQASVFLILSAL